MKQDQLEAYLDPYFFDSLESFLQGDKEEIMPDVERKRENKWVKERIGELKYTQKEDISRKYSLDERISLFQHLAALAPNLNDSCQEEGRTLYNLYQSIPEEERSKLCPQGYEDTDFSRIIDRIGEITPSNWPYENICMTGWEFKNRFIHENYPEDSSLFTTGLRSLAFLLNGLDRYQGGEERFETFFGYFIKDVDKLKDHRRDVIERVSSELRINPTGDSNIQNTFSWISFNRSHVDKNVYENIRSYLADVVEKSLPAIDKIREWRDDSNVYVRKLCDGMVADVIRFPERGEECLEKFKQEIDIVKSSVEFAQNISSQYSKHRTIDHTINKFITEILIDPLRLSYEQVLKFEDQITSMGQFVEFSKRINADQTFEGIALRDSKLSTMFEGTEVTLADILEYQAKVELHNLGTFPNEHLVAEYLSDSRKRAAAKNWGKAQKLLGNSGFNRDNACDLSTQSKMIVTLGYAEDQQEKFDQWKRSFKDVLITSYLFEDLEKAEDKDSRVDEWKKTIDSFTEGNFDAGNELHVNLEYTRFRKIVDHEKVSKHIKNNFTFNDYLSIFNREITDNIFTEKELFEIECVAEEAGLLREYVLMVNEHAREIGRELKVVPNLSYGYLPTSCLFTEFEQEGIESIIGVKVGSTECHGSKEVVNSRLLKGNRTKLANQGPIVVVVDGTYNLDPAKNRNGVTRYPDAHQGYLNQIIALNDALGFIEEDYSHVGKSTEDLERLRETVEFKRTVEVYGHVLKENDSEPYQFQLWNTAGLDLGIRGEREIVDTIEPYHGHVDQPTMIFCNVGLLDEQISSELKSKFPEMTHNPAFWDDKGRIIQFDFGHDQYGVRYLNRLETKLQEKYDSMNNNPTQIEGFVPAIIKYLTKNKDAHQLDEAI
jgi:hypothetical protein